MLMQSDFDWLQEHRANFVEFHGQWIAILGKQVICSAPSFDQMYDSLDRKTRGNTLIVFIPDDPRGYDYLIA